MLFRSTSDENASLEEGALGSAPFEMCFKKSPRLKTTVPGIGVAGGKLQDASCTIVSN